MSDQRMLRVARELAEVKGLDRANVAFHLRKAIAQGSLPVLNYLGISREDLPAIEALDADRPEAQRREVILSAAERVIRDLGRR